MRGREGGNRGKRGGGKGREGRGKGRKDCDHHKVFERMFCS